jgi:hypothetical protein
MLNTYTVYLGATPIACVSGHDAAYACYEAAKTLAEYTGKEASLVWDETSEEVAYFEPAEEFSDEPADIDDDCGFDPYAGCYTYDC